MRIKLLFDIPSLRVFIMKYLLFWEILHGISKAVGLIY